MNRRPNFYQRPIPRRLAGLGAVPTWATAPINPATWTPPSMTPPSMPTPSTAPQVPCGSQECGDFVVSEMKPMNFTRSENVWLALLAGGVVGYWLGKGWS